MARNGPAQARPISAQQGACWRGARASSGWISVPKRMPAAGGSAAAPLALRQRHQACRDSPAQQRLARLPLRRLAELREEPDLAAGEHRDRDAVPVQDTVASERTELRAGGQDADEVQRIG